MADEVEKEEARSRALKHLDSYRMDGIFFIVEKEEARSRVLRQNKFITIWYL